MERINIINSTKIFLNAFGLVLQDSDNNNREIYDSDDNIVGYMNNYVNKAISITARENGNNLTANIKPYAGRLSRKFHRIVRSSLTRFEIRNNNSIILMNGDMCIAAGCTQNLPISYRLAFKSAYRDSKGRNVELSINGGRILSVAITKGNVIETFEIGGIKNVFKHTLQKGNFDKKLNAFPYCKEVSITSDDECTKIDLSEKIINGGKVKEKRRLKKQLPKPISDNGDFRASYEKTIIQAMELVHKYDSTIGKEIKAIKDDLDNYCELFVNLISMCYDDYSDEVIDSIFGIERRNIYQDGAKNLRDACLGIKTAPELTKVIGECE